MVLSGSSSSADRPSSRRRPNGPRVELPAEIEAPSTDDLRWLRNHVRSWYRTHGREFAWRESRDPYDVLIAELLLQRTRADLVPRVFSELQTRFPDSVSLAGADTSEVLEVLRPLGFTHRSERIPLTAKTLVDRFGGEVPATEEELLSLPGVGRYVANAVLVVAFGLPRPLLDPNVLRVLDRSFGVRSTRSRPRDDVRLWRLVGEVVTGHRPQEVALGLIDLGAVVCRPARPRCFECPLRSRCRAFLAGAVVPAT
jgi:A/G-specific adenine glycosylase